MVDAGTVTVSVISAPQNPLPESEMDALLLGRTKVSFILFDGFSCSSFVKTTQP